MTTTTPKIVTDPVAAAIAAFIKANGVTRIKQVPRPRGITVNAKNRF